MSLVEIVEKGANGQPLTAAEFVANLRLSHPQWWEGVSGHHTPWVFRGVGNYPDWKLLPSAWRNPSKLDSLRKSCARRLNADQIGLQAGQDDHDWPLLGHAGRMLVMGAEREALKQFQKACLECGFEVDPTKIPGFESILEMPPSPERLRNHPSPIAALAQHHGVPTSLLDWTRNGMTAAYFSVSPPWVDDSANAIAVWAYRSDRRNFHGAVPGLPKQNDDVEIRVYEPPPFQNQFLQAQQGLFTMHDDPFSYYDKAGWPGFEELIQGASPRPGDPSEPVLRAFVLPRREFVPLLETLEREGIHAAGLMPTLDNVAKVVMDRWQRERPAPLEPKQ
jgi:hypothetical protein